jgi:DMSO/TMAO reductase YedYZ molybdopterin-dependent catalytic subunit
VTSAATAAVAGAGGVLLTGCERVAESPAARALVRAGERLTMRAQRILMARRPLVREFTSADISKFFPTTGTERPSGDSYARLVATAFRTFRLKLRGLVTRPLEFSLDDIRRLPHRTQITQHQCDAGWSAIAQWTGVPVGHLLQLAGLRTEARYIVFHCLDAMDAGGEHYYESLDLFDAFHPQTILAYDMNDSALPVNHGAPLRLRAELHIGYKNAKYVESLEAVASLDGIRGGQGSYWADRGFQWYVGM